MTFKPEQLSPNKIENVTDFTIMFRPSPISNAQHMQTELDSRPTQISAGGMALDQAPEKPSLCMNSTDILRGQKAIEIRHNGSTYRLQATRLGKLILTK